MDCRAGVKERYRSQSTRAIIVEFMLDIMFEDPKDPEIGSVTITRAYLEKHGWPADRDAGVFLHRRRSGSSGRTSGSGSIKKARRLNKLKVS